MSEIKVSGKGRKDMDRPADEETGSRRVSPGPWLTHGQRAGRELGKADIHLGNAGTPDLYREGAARTARRTSPASCRGAIRPGGRTPAPFAAAALLAFLAALLAPLLLPGCTSSKPERVVRDFIRARMEGDEKRAAGLTLEGDLSDFPGGEAFLTGSGVSFDAATEEVSADRARVAVHFRWEEGDELEISYICRREGSRWKVSLRETEELWLPDIELHGEEGNR